LFIIGKALAIITVTIAALFPGPELSRQELAIAMRE